MPQTKPSATKSSAMEGLLRKQRELPRRFFGQAAGFSRAQYMPIKISTKMTTLAEHTAMRWLITFGRTEAQMRSGQNDITQRLRMGRMIFGPAMREHRRALTTVLCSTQQRSAESFPRRRIVFSIPRHHGPPRLA